MTALALSFWATTLVVSPAVLLPVQSVTPHAVKLSRFNTVGVVGTDNAVPGLRDTMLTALMARLPLKLAYMHIGKADTLAISRLCESEDLPCDGV